MNAREMIEAVVEGSDPKELLFEEDNLKSTLSGFKGFGSPKKKGKGHWFEYPDNRDVTWLAAHMQKLGYKQVTTEPGVHFWTKKGSSVVVKRIQGDSGFLVVELPKPFSTRKSLKGF